MAVDLFMEEFLEKCQRCYKKKGLFLEKFRSRKEKINQPIKNWNLWDNRGNNWISLKCSKWKAVGVNPPIEFFFKG